MGLPFPCLPCPVHPSPSSCNAIHPGPPTPELLDTSLESPAKPQTTASTAGLVFGVLFPHVPLKCDPSSTVTCSSCAYEMVEIRGKRAGSKASPAGGPRRLSWHGCLLPPPSLWHTRCSGGRPDPSLPAPPFLPQDLALLKAFCPKSGHPSPKAVCTEHHVFQETREAVSV